MTEEKELKLMLDSKEDFTKVMELLSPVIHCSSFKNHYYLVNNRRDIAHLRIREDSKNLTWTVKLNSRKHEGLFLSTEIEGKINEEQFKHIHEGKKIQLDMMDRLGALMKNMTGSTTVFFTYLGAVQNTRSTFKWNLYMVEMDESVFPGGKTEFEIEIEYENQKPPLHFCELLEEADINWSYSKKTKYVKFLEYLSLSEGN